MELSQMENQIKSKISSIFTNDIIGIETYFILEVEGGKYVVTRANIVSDADNDILMLLKDYTEEKLIFNENLSVINLSQADERKNALYIYDIEEVPEILCKLKDVSENCNFQNFNFNNYNFNQVKGIVFAIGNSDNKFFIYKHNYSISIIKRDSKFIGLLKDKERLVKLKDDILKINRTFDLFFLDNNYYILNIKTLEKFYGFQEALINLAKKGLEKIIEVDILEQPELIEKRIVDISFSRKLIKATKNSPVLGVVSKNEIIEFIMKHDYLSSKFKYSLSGDKLDLKTKISQDYFLQILSDDFLKSELTKKHYSSLAKNTLNYEKQKTLDFKVDSVVA